MYAVSRLMLVCGLLALGYSGVVLCLAEPLMIWAFGIMAIIALAKRKRSQLTTLGSARWADTGDLSRAGMLGASSGLILGRIQAQGGMGEALRRLRGEKSAREAVLGFWGAFKKRAELVRLSKVCHTAVFSPTGGGKGVSCVLPFLLTCKESCVVVDFKGENAKITAEHRRKKFGHKIVLLDPYGVVTDKSDSLNCLDGIAKGDPTGLDHCNDIAKALVVRPPEEKEPHWSDGAEAFIATGCALAVDDGDDSSRSLQTVCDMLSHPNSLQMMVEAACASEAWEGMLSRMGGQLMRFVDKELASVLTTTARHLRFLGTPAIAKNTKDSSFDPEELLQGKMTIYLILPPEHMRAQMGLLRLWVTTLLRAVIKGGLQEKMLVHFVLDEAASLGKLDAIEDVVDKYRGYGVRAQFYYQSLGQLKKCFPEGQDQTLLSNTSQVFFGVNDPATADYVSNRLGESTILLESWGENRGSNRGHSSSSRDISSSGGSSSGSSHNTNQTARKLLKPEEVSQLPARTAITFTPGVRPICTTLLRYYEEKNLSGEQWGVVDAVGTFLKSAVFFAVSVGAAWAFSQ